MRITQRQIAEIVGVSSVAVSNVLHRPHNARISLEKQQEIMRVAEQIGYQPRRATTHTIGFVVAAGEMHLDATENEIVLTHEILQRHGYRMLFAMAESKKPDALREVLNQKTVDGILFNIWCDGKIKSLWPENEVPWVLLSDDQNIGEDTDQVSTDTVQVAANVTRHLVDLGHRRLCLVAGPAGIGYHERLKRGVKKALREAGLADECVVNIEVGYNGEIAEPLLKLMASSTPPTAIMAASAGKSIVVLNHLLAAGYRVPSDASLVSFGDSHRLMPLMPAISANTIFDRDVIEGAIEKLIRKIRAPDLPAQRVLLAGRYIERGSVGPPKPQ